VRDLQVQTKIDMKKTTSRKRDDPRRETQQPVPGKPAAETARPIQEDHSAGSAAAFSAAEDVRYDDDSDEDNDDFAMERGH
jgi:hypothetical protein